MSFKNFHKLFSIPVITIILFSGCLQKQTEESAEIALWLDDEPIMIDELKQRISVKLQTWGFVADLDEQDLARIADICINELAQERIIRKKAKELGVYVDLEDIRNGGESFLPYDAEGFDVLKQSEEQWWNRVVSSMELLTLSSNIADTLGGHLEITDDMLRDEYLKRIDFFTKPAVIEHQVIRVSDGDLANEIHRQLKQRAVFESLAKKHSNIRGQGAMGEFVSRQAGEFPVEIESELLALSERQISPVFRTQDGYYVYKVHKKHEPVVLSLEQVRDSLQLDLETALKTRLFQNWLDRETRKVSIRYGTPLPYGGM